MSGAKFNADGRLGLMLTDWVCRRSSGLPAICATNLIAEAGPRGNCWSDLSNRKWPNAKFSGSSCIALHRVSARINGYPASISLPFQRFRAPHIALTEGHAWLDGGTNLLAFGPPGSGKPHLLSGIGHALVDAGKRVLFMQRCGTTLASCAAGFAHAAGANQA